MMSLADKIDRFLFWICPPGSELGEDPNNFKFRPTPYNLEMKRKAIERFRLEHLDMDPDATPDTRE